MIYFRFISIFLFYFFFMFCFNWKRYHATPIHSICRQYFVLFHCCREFIKLLFLFYSRFYNNNKLFYISRWRWYCSHWLLFYLNYIKQLLLSLNAFNWRAQQWSKIMKKFYGKKYYSQASMCFQMGLKQCLLHAPKYGISYLKTHLRTHDSH